MGWITLYIQGRSGCTSEVLKHLEQSDISFMPGSVSGEKNIALYWVDEKTGLREFKKAIGSKTIFKYRLRFFTSLEEARDFQNPGHHDSDEDDEFMIPDVSGWDEMPPQHKRIA